MTSITPNFFGVRQHEYGITNSRGERYIGTPDVSSCVVIIVYNRMCKEAVLAHLDNRTATDENIKKIFDKISDRPGALQVSFVGGWKTGKAKPTSIENFIPKTIMNLEDNYGYDVDRRFLFKFNHFENSYSYVGIDTENGNLQVSTDSEQCPPSLSDLSKKDINTIWNNPNLDFAGDKRGRIVFDETFDLNDKQLDYYKSIEQARI